MGVLLQTCFNVEQVNSYLSKKVELNPRNLPTFSIERIALTTLKEYRIELTFLKS